MSLQTLTITQGMETLRFVVGGREIAAVRLNVLILVTPFTRLVADIESSKPKAAQLVGKPDIFVIPAHPVAEEVQRLTFAPGMIRYVGPSAPRYSISLHGTFADYLAKFSHKSRYNIVRSVRKFAEHSGGEIKVREFSTPEQLKEFARLADEISRYSWAVKIGGGGFAGRVPEAQLMKLAHERAARGFVLFDHERPIAYVFCHAQSENLLYEYIAYDETYAKWSPGTVLLYLLVESLFREQRFERLDLGEGTLGYKSFFATDATPCVRVIYFRRRLRYVILVFAHLGLARASIAMGGLLRTVGMKTKLKRLMMGKARRPGQELERSAKAA